MDIVHMLWTRSDRTRRIDILKISFLFSAECRNALSQTYTSMNPQTKLNTQSCCLLGYIEAIASFVFLLFL